jgi:hypothetical protein
MQLAVAEKGLWYLMSSKAPQSRRTQQSRQSYLRYPLSNGLTINSKKISEVLGPVK